MKGTVKTWIGVAALMAFSAAAMGADAAHHWQMEGDATDSVGTNDGTPQGGVGHYTWETDVAGSYIYDPLSTNYRTNTGSALFTTGGSHADSGINVGALQVMDSFWKEWTVEVIFKGPANQAEEATLFGRYPTLPNQAMSQFIGMGFTGTPDDLYPVMAANGFAGAIFFTAGTPPSLTDGAWHHVAMTYSHLGGTWSTAADPAPTFTLTMSLWVDYQFVGTQSIEWTGYLQQRQADPYDHEPSTAQGKIGGLQTPPLDNVHIDEVRILDYAVPDAANGRDHFLQPLPRVPAATHHWQLDGDATDSVGTNDGTPQGGVGHYTWATDVSDGGIYDPLSDNTRANTGSALFATGGNHADSGINVGALEVMDSFWEEWTVEVIFKGPANQAEEATLFGRYPTLPNQAMSQFTGMGFTGTPDDLYPVMAANGFAGAIFFTAGTPPSLTDGAWHHAAMTYSHSGGTWSTAADPAPTFTLTMSLWVDYQFVDTQSIEWTGYLQQRQADPYDHEPSTAPGKIGGLQTPPLNNVHIDEVRILNYAVPDAANGLDHFLQSVPKPATGTIVILR